MKGSKWLILIVILVVIGVVIAKQARNSSRSAEPEAVAQAPAQGQPAPPATEVEAPNKGASAPPTQAGQEPPSKPEAPPASAKLAGGNQPQREQPKPSAEVKEPDKPASNLRPQPSADQPAEPKEQPGDKPEGPLPGSRLKDCLKNGLPTMADFGMGTCLPCKAMEPILKQATQDYWGRANILFVELDKYRDLAREYGIRVMPTQIFFDASGKQVDSHMGFMDREEIDRRLAALGAKQ